MTSQSQVYNKKYRNHSNLQLTDNIQNEGINNQPNYSYRTYSQIGNLLNDNPSKNNKDQEGITARSNQVSRKNQHLYIYKNKFAQQEQQVRYKVPENHDPQFQRTNTNFIQFLNKKRKFTKPYAECTKYVDNLVKNKQLLRRGQFDLPVQNGLTGQTFTKYQSRNIPIKTQNTQLMKSRNYRKKQYQSIEAIKQKTRKKTMKTDFTRTVQNHYDSYRELMKVQRNTKKDHISMKNSMNRILAAEMINFKLNSDSRNIGIQNLGRTKSMKLDKTH